MEPGRWVTRHSKLGFPHQVWEPPVPRISDDFIDCCVYLYPSHADAEAGSKIGGSGFLIAYEFPKIPGTNLIYAVTNRHVAEAGNSTIRLNTKDGRTDIFDVDERKWIYHPDGDDLAMVLMPSFDNRPYRFKYIKEDDHFLTKAAIDEFNIGPGDDIFVAGRFINQEGKQQNLPSVRFGNLAQMPPETVRQQRGTGFFEQESFIVEAKSIGGYSGSPVLVGMDPTLTRPNRNGLVSNRVFLLGVCWGYINDWQPVCGPDGLPVPGGLQVRSNTGMMAVVPAWKLSEMLHTSAIEAHHTRVEEILLKKRAELPAVPTAVSVQIAPQVANDLQPNDENPTHREDFMRLVGAAARKPEPKD